MSPHAHLARSPVGIAGKVWLEAVGREPGENSPWDRSHVLAQRPKLASERLIPQEWLNLAPGNPLNPDWEGASNHGIHRLLTKPTGAVPWLGGRLVRLACP